LSNTGSSCFETTNVAGYSRVPLPPAKMIPLLSILLIDAIMTGLEDPA
jgi:hypothetical protein